jgi:hypothetical protein
MNNQNKNNYFKSLTGVRLSNLRFLIRFRYEKEGGGLSDEVPSSDLLDDRKILQNRRCQQAG